MFFLIDTATGNIMMISTNSVIPAITGSWGDLIAKNIYVWQKLPTGAISLSDCSVNAQMQLVLDLTKQAANQVIATNKTAALARITGFGDKKNPSAGVPELVQMCLDLRAFIIGS